MDRTLKVKIALGVTLVFLAARMVLGFFPVPLEFAPYSTTGEKTALQRISFSEITHAFSVLDVQGDPVHYYWVEQTDGTVGAVCSRVKYIDERFEEPVTFTGIINFLEPMEDPANSSAIVVPEGGKIGDYAEMEKIAILNRDFTDTTTDHPACIWVAGCAFLSFCVMLAMLLRDYAGGKRKPLPDKEG